MKHRLSDLILEAAHHAPAAPAIKYRDEVVSYERLAARVETAARGLLELGLGRGDRVAVYLEKRVETVVAILAASAAGGVFVPVNPLFKPRHVRHVLQDCEVRVLVTSAMRLAALEQALADCPRLNRVIVVDADAGPAPGEAAAAVTDWDEMLNAGQASARAPHRVIETDMAAILYTSGSTGMPKGVVLSHRNLLVGAESVSAYLDNRPDDRLLAVLPLSFDAGLSQITTAFQAGASAVLMNYLLPRDVVRLCAAERITGLTCVPPLWIQLAQLDWPSGAAASLRYFANTGGRLPRPTLERLRAALPGAKPFLMYGLTEAFRSTYLDPREVDRRPDSIGKAIPNAEILVVGEDGRLCGPGETGELVHRGPLVAMGYWNDPERTAERFRPAPGRPAGLCVRETAVWSGDQVRMDEDGFLYFVGRRDDMIKTSGYRVSPTEVEEVLYASGLVGEAAAVGAPHPVLGQAIVALITAPGNGEVNAEAVLEACRRELPAYMVPQRVVARRSLPRNPNGKIDRRALAEDVKDLFRESPS